MTRSDHNGRNHAYASYFTTTYAHRNEVTAEGIQRVAEAYRREVACYLPQKTDEPILEIGCGIGGFLLCCRNLGYSRVVGIDISREQVDRCREMGFRNVQQDDALSYLSRSEQRFAVIVMFDVLEHIPRSEILPTLQAARDRLLPSGRVIARVPNLSNPLNLRTRYVDFTHEAGFTQESLAQVLRIAGFEVVTVQGLFAPHRRWLARILFDQLLWRMFRFLYRHTFHLKDEPLRGKNLLAVGAKPNG